MRNFDNLSEINAELVKLHENYERIDRQLRAFLSSRQPGAVFAVERLNKRLDAINDRIIALHWVRKNG